MRIYDRDLTGAAEAGRAPEMQRAGRENRSGSAAPGAQASDDRVEFSSRNIDLDHCQVSIGVRPDQFCADRRTAGKGNGDLVRPFNDMVVRYNVTLHIPYEARSKGFLGTLTLA